MKPDWKDAPKWANYLAMDQDGSWGWFELEPSTARGHEWRNESGNSEYAIHYINWQESLESKPK